ILREYANVSCDVRGDGRAEPDYEGAAVGQDLLGQSYRKLDSSGFTRCQANASARATQPRADETELSILQPESVRPCLGIDPEGSQCRRLRAGRFSKSTDGTRDHPAREELTSGGSAMSHTQSAIFTILLNSSR